MAESIYVLFILQTITLTLPIAFAALGELITERSGVINLGTEGMMLMGSFAGFSLSFLLKDAWYGFAFSILVGVLMGILMGFLSITLKIDQIVAGLGVFFFGLGLSAFLYRVQFGVGRGLPSIRGFENAQIPLLSNLPVVGPLLFGQDPLFYIAILTLIATIFLLDKTMLGLKIRACGENPAAADTLGVSVVRIRYLTLIIAGILASIGGATYVIETHVFQENLTAGRGFIAVAMVYFGKWKPIRTFLGSLLFGGAFALLPYAQFGGVCLTPTTCLPSYIILMIPYLLTLVALIAVSRRAREPSALGTPYRREAG
jgi:simple sugar transport system permease protein